MEGERKQVTVLFADVKSSLDLQQDMDPEEWHGIMDRFFQILADSVHRFEGTVNQYTGDGIMALFGAPIAHEDHAQRACYAALHLSDAAGASTRDELRRERGLDFSTRMGINSGEVVVGRIGDDLRMDYTAQGHAVGLAARMESLAEPGKVYLTDTTRPSSSRGFFELESLGEFNVKGVADPVPVFELAGVGMRCARASTCRARAVSRASSGATARSACSSRALEAAKRRARAAPSASWRTRASARAACASSSPSTAGPPAWQVLQASGVAHGKNIPLLPILEMFRGYFGIEDHGTNRRARARRSPGGCC